jgi:hypothetical protein
MQLFLYAFFWVIRWRQKFKCRFGTLCLFHLHRQVSMKSVHTYLPMKMGQECSERLAFKLQMPGNNPDESISHSKHGKILKSRNAAFAKGSMLNPDTSNFLRGHQLLSCLISKSYVANLFPVIQQI